MTLKLNNGAYVLKGSGLPETVDGLDELLQNALIRLTVPKGSFPYGRDMGSRLGGLDMDEEHPMERALAYANEALGDMQGVEAVEVRPVEEGLAFRLTTPLGEGEVIYGSL